MSRLVPLALVLGALGATLPLTAAHARAKICVEIRDPEHAESYFLCV
jgi:hypothetical protein